MGLHVHLQFWPKQSIPLNRHPFPAERNITRIGRIHFAGHPMAGIHGGDDDARGTAFADEATPSGWKPEKMTLKPGSDSAINFQYLNAAPITPWART